MNPTFSQNQIIRSDTSIQPTRTFQSYWEFLIAFFSPRKFIKLAVALLVVMLAIFAMLTMFAVSAFNSVMKTDTTSLSEQSQNKAASDLKLAQASDVTAQNKISVSLDNVSQEYDQAKMWLKESTQQGLANTKKHLDKMSNKNVNMKYDDPQALTSCKQSAEQGNAEAQYNLGYLPEKYSRLNTNETRRQRPPCTNNSI